MATLNPVLEKINTQIVNYTPAAVVGIQAIQAATGQTELQKVVVGTLAVTNALQSSPNPNVAAAAGLANLLLSLISLFTHKSPPVTAHPVVQVAVQTGSGQ